MAAADGVIRRKVSNARGELGEGGPGADRGWRIALARAARDHLKLPLEVTELILSRAGLAEVLELPPDCALVAAIEGPGEGLGVIAIAPAVTQAMIEALTIGKLSAGSPIGARKPTRTDAAMIAPMLDAALMDLEGSLAQEADLIWAGGWRYASFMEDARPLGLILEDISYRVLRAEVDLGLGQRKGQILVAVPADGRGKLPARSAACPVVDEVQANRAFADSLAQEVEAAECQLDAVLARVSLSLSRVVGLKVGDVLPMAVASLDRVSVEGLDGRKLSAGKLGQNRGMRALRLGAAISHGKAASSPPARATVERAEPEVPLGFRQSA